MRVGYVMSRFPKLTETFVLNEIRAMDALGVTVEIFPLLRERQRVVHPEADAWARRARFHPFLSWAILASNVRVLRHAPRTWLGVLADVLRGTWGSRNFFVGALGIFPKSVHIALEMRAHGVDHVHAHFATHPALAAYIIHRVAGIPFSFTAHGSDLHVERRMLPEKLAAAAFAVAVSEYNREVMVRECGEAARGRIHVIHCGIDPHFFTAPPRPRPEPGPLRLICVASFEEVKGHRFLLEACALLRDRGVAVTCDLVGSGPLQRGIQRQIHALALEEVIHIQGPRPRQEVVRLLHDADVAVLASHPTREGKREGIPVALMEAMATALPVVSTAISGIPELVRPGETGFLVPPRDPHALADAIEQLASDPALRARMGHAARERVRTHFNLLTSARMLQRLFADEPLPLPTRPVARAGAAV